MIEELKKSLPIDKFALDDELTQQPSLFQSVAEAYVEAAADRDRLKEELAVIDAQLDSEARFEQGDLKYTEQIIKNAVQTDIRHRGAFERYLKARIKAEELGALKESFAQRAYLIRDLIQLHITGYFHETSVKGGEDARYKDQRQRMARARYRD